VLSPWGAPLKIAILAGMEPNSAVAINKSRDLGTLEPGEIANIVIAGVDPLQDVINLTRVVLVVKDGRVVNDHHGPHH
jgi:imidazolonepropionase-like amidohydrolase